MPETIPSVTPPVPASQLAKILGTALVVAVAGAGYLGWQVSTLTSENAELARKMAALTPAASSSAQPIRSTTPASASASASASAAPIVISQALKDNIAAAISSKNTAALEGYMAPSVKVVNTAGKNVSETPTQAVADVDFVSGGTTPWNFNLSTATLGSYKNGSYGAYFGDGTYVGKSANNYVISFGVNASGKITTIFMAQNANLLN